MKRFKRVIALLIVAVLVMSMGMGAMASGQGDGDDGDEPVTVTIQNGEYDSNYYTKGADEIDYTKHTYKAAQILAAEEYDATTKQYIGLKWGTDVQDNGVALLAKLKADSTWGTTFANYVIAPTDVDDTHPQFTAASFAKAIEGAPSANADVLAQVLKSLYANTGTTISGTNEVELPDGIGYYLIDDVTTALNNDAANPVVLFAAPGSNMVRIKTDKPSQVKQVKENEAAKAEWNEVSDYNIGDAVPYRITSTVPNVHYYESYDMKFTDTMSDGLTLFDNWNGIAPSNLTAANIKVTVNNVDVTANANIDKNDHGFVLTLPIKAKGTQATWAVAGEEVAIEFYGVLNQSAVIGLAGNSNTSKLEYSNNPDDTSSTTETPTDTVLTFTYELDVHKTDGATEEPLRGAQFALKATDGAHRDMYAVVNANGVVVKWQAAAPAADSQGDSDGSALLKSDKDGNFSVIGLDDGQYSLEEIKAPEGYNKIDPITIEIIGGTVHTEDGETPAKALTSLDVKVAGQEAEGDINEGKVLANVVNNSGASLPETGGIGTTMFYIVGAALVIGAGVVLVSRRRMNVQ